MANKINDYLKSAQTWDEDIRELYDRALRNADIRSWVFGGGMLLALTGLVVVVLKYKQPDAVLFEVDRSTGIVQKVETVTDGKTTYGEKVDEYFIWQYINYRESFSMALGREYYRAVGLMSAASEQERYSNYMKKENPASPINVYKDTGRVRVRVKNFSKVNEKTYLVRYLKEIQLPGKPPEISHWVATLVYHYSGAPMDEQDRLINPLGMIIDEYRNNPETVGKVQ